MQLQLAPPRTVLEHALITREEVSLCDAPLVEVGCDLCGRTDGFVTLHERLPSIDTASRVLQCPDCGLVFLSPRLASSAHGWTQSVSFLEFNYLPELQLRGICTHTLNFDHDGNLNWHAQLLTRWRAFAASQRYSTWGVRSGPRCERRVIVGGARMVSSRRPYWRPMAPLSCRSISRSESSIGCRCRSATSIA